MGSDPIAVMFAQTSNDSSYNGADYMSFDNVKLSYVSAVPEPSAYAAIIGCIALGFAGWRRRRRQIRPA